MKKETGYILELFPHSKKMTNHFKVYWRKKDAVAEDKFLPRDARRDVIKVYISTVHTKK